MLYSLHQTALTAMNLKIMCPSCDYLTTIQAFRPLVMVKPLIVKTKQVISLLLKIKVSLFDTIYPEGERDFYVPATYIEPFASRNLKVFGYDMFFEAERRKTMEQARDTDRRRAPATDASDPRSCFSTAVMRCSTLLCA